MWLSWGQLFRKDRLHRFSCLQDQEDHVVLDIYHYVFWFYGQNEWPIFWSWCFTTYTVIYYMGAAILRDKETENLGEKLNHSGYKRTIATEGNSYGTPSFKVSLNVQVLRKPADAAQAALLVAVNTVWHSTDLRWEKNAVMTQARCTGHKPGTFSKTLVERVFRLSSRESQLAISDNISI